MDVALLPVSGTYVMTAEEAAEAARRIQPRLAVPMHWGEHIGTKEDAERFAELTPVAGRNIGAGQAEWTGRVKPLADMAREDPELAAGSFFRPCRPRQRRCPGKLDLRARRRRASASTRS